jgi:hypothetical protein
MNNTDRPINEDNVPQYTAGLARTLYEAYTANSGNLNYQGLPCPKWDDLPQAIRDHWCAVSDKAQDELRAHWNSK